MSSHNPVEKYLIEAIESIYKQTYQEFEIIVIDDGSDYLVEEIFKRNNLYSEKVKIIRLENNKGLPYALNVGLKYCKGEFIARMDDDDIMAENRLELQMKFLKNNSNAIGCWSNFRRIDKNGLEVKRSIIRLKKEKILSYLISRGNQFCHSTLFVKKSALESINGYDENFKYAQDSDLYIRLLEKYKNGMGVVQEVLVDFRINTYRNDYYRASLSMTYAFLGAFLYFIRNRKYNYKCYLWFIKRILRYVINCLRVKI